MSRLHRSHAADPVCSVQCVSHVDSCGFDVVVVVVAFAFSCVFVLRIGIVCLHLQVHCAFPSIAFLCLTLIILTVDLMSDCD